MSRSRNFPPTALLMILKVSRYRENTEGSREYLRQAELKSTPSLPIIHEDPERVSAYGHNEPFLGSSEQVHQGSISGGPA